MPSSTGDLLVQKRDEWLSALRGHDPNSINNQIDALVWELACLMVLSSGGDLALGATTGAVRLNSVIFTTVHRCLFESVARRIRRLWDPKQKDPKKDVYSLLVVLRDMLAHAHSLTRANILSVEKLSCSNPNWAAHRYNTIDRLTGTDSEESRRPENQIPAAWFATRIRWVDGNRDDHERRRSHVSGKDDDCEEGRVERIINFVNKYIAHAATPQSREVIPHGAMTVHLALLWKTTARMCKMAHELCVDVLGDSSCPPVPSLEPLEWVQEQEGLDLLDRDVVQEFWHRIVKRVERWYGVRSGGGFFPD